MTKINKTNEEILNMSAEEERVIRRENMSDIKYIIKQGLNINDRAKIMIDRFINYSNNASLLDSFKLSLDDTRNELKEDDNITTAIVAMFTKVNTVLNNIIKLNKDKIEITPKEDFLGLNIGTLNTKLTDFIKKSKEDKIKIKEAKMEADKMEDIEALEALKNKEVLSDNQQLEVIELEAKINKQKILDKIKEDKIEADKKIIDAQIESEQNTLINMLKLFGAMENNEIKIYLLKLDASKLNSLNKIMLSLATDEA